MKTPRRAVWGAVTCVVKLCVRNAYSNPVAKSSSLFKSKGVFGLLSSSSTTYQKLFFFARRSIDFCCQRRKNIENRVKLALRRLRRRKIDDCSGENRLHQCENSYTRSRKRYLHHARDGAPDRSPGPPRGGWEGVKGVESSGAHTHLMCENMLNTS